MQPILRKLSTTGLWLLTILEMLTMGLAGISKFIPGNPWPQMFVAWGYPAWFAVMIGAFEVAGALGLLIPRLAPSAAGGLIAIMLGALYTVLTNENQLGWGMVVFHLVLLTGILVLRTGPLYSQRRARIGSTPDARLAGR